MKKVSYEEFISRLDKNFTYTIVSPYISFTDDIVVRDKYGKLKTKPCYLIKNRPLSILSAINKTSYIIKKFKEVHGSKYDYSKFEYITALKEGIIICKVHGEFKQLPFNHIRQGCHRCGVSNNGFSKVKFNLRSKGKVCNLYLIRCWNNTEEFIKIGITSQTIKKRFIRERDMPYNYEILHLETSYDSDYIFEKEKLIKTKFKTNKYNPNISFAGKTECYTLNTLQNIIKYLKTTEKR